MNYGGYKYGDLTAELKSDWRAQFKEWGEDTLRERMKDPDDPTSPGHPRHELAVEWLGKRDKAKARFRWIAYGTATGTSIFGLLAGLKWFR